MDFKACIYQNNDDDEAKRLQYMRQEMTEEEIRQVKESKEWKCKYDKYLQKILLPAPTVCNNLHQWIQKYENTTDHLGKDLFSTKTKKRQC